MALIARAWRRWWRSGWLPVLLIAAVATLLGFPPDQPAKQFPDSMTYTTWGFGRPPTAFLFYALVGDGRAACVVQTVLSSVSWSALGWVALGLPGAVFGAALSLSMPIALWNYGILSESLTLSLGAALVAATLALGRRWSRARFAVWASAALLFTDVRVENFVLVAPMVAALLVWHRHRWRALGTVGALAGAMFIVWGVLVDVDNHNWQTRMTNIVLTRILQYPEMREYFQAAGMPREETLFHYRGQMLVYYDDQFRATTPQFQHWLDTESRATYMRWLGSAMPHRQLIQAIDTVTGRPFYDYYVSGLHLAPTSLDLVGFFDRVRVPFRRWLWLAAVPVVGALLSLPLRFADLFGVVFLGAVYGMAFASYHGDAGELERHMMLVVGLYRVAPLVAFAGVWERLVAGLASLVARSAPPLGSERAMNNQRACASDRRAADGLRSREPDLDGET